jgi:hypothetical protein
LTPRTQASDRRSPAEGALHRGRGARVLLVIVALVLGAARAHAQTPDAATRARHHYEAGVGLFEGGNKEQALVEFQLANELSPKKENLFMIAQCQYHLGWLKEARANYQEFLTHPSAGDMADIARMRIEAINHRPGIIVINAVPDQVQVRITGEGQVFAGDAPNEFRVPRGRYRVQVSKTNFTSQEREISLDVADTKPLFFKLDPIPARLEIRTTPSNATLYVRGNRAQNPYAQNVEPGVYEVYAEAPYHLPRHDSVSLEPGQKLNLDFPLTYIQRSGRPELIGFWTGISAVGGALTVMVRLLTSSGNLNLSEPGNLTLMGTGALAGGIGGAVISTSLVPSYIRDNQALFRIGAGWVGDVEGLSFGLALNVKLRGALLGGVAGLALGSVAGWWLDDHAPNYGRVTLIQSAAFLGALGGMLAVPAMNFRLRDDFGNLARNRIGWGMLAGTNVGLLTGLALAYLPDQRVYGPSWQRIMLIDLATVAGGFAGALVQTCSAHGDKTKGCGGLEVGPDMARYALVGSLVGLAAGWVLTMKYDKPSDDNSDRAPAGAIPMPGPVPVQTSDGHWQMIPGLVANGKF